MTSFCSFYHSQDGNKTTDLISIDILEISENCLRYSTEEASHVSGGQQVQHLSLQHLSDPGDCTPACAHPWAPPSATPDSHQPFKAELFHHSHTCPSLPGYEWEAVCIWWVFLDFFPKLSWWYIEDFEGTHIYNIPTDQQNQRALSSFSWSKGLSPKTPWRRPQGTVESPSVCNSISCAEIMQ